MTTVHDLRPLYASVTTQLETTGKAVGQAISPGGDLPYMVLFPREDAGSDGSLTDPNQIRYVTFQVSCFGNDMAEAQWMQDRAQDALLGFTPTGGTPIEAAFLSGVLRDDDGPVFFTADRYLVYVS